MDYLVINSLDNKRIANFLRLNKQTSHIGYWHNGPISRTLDEQGRVDIDREKIGHVASLVIIKKKTTI